MLCSRGALSNVILLEKVTLNKALKPQEIKQTISFVNHKTSRKTDRKKRNQSALAIIPIIALKNGIERSRFNQKPLGC